MTTAQLSGLSGLIGAVGFGFWSTAAMLPSRSRFTDWCALIGIGLLSISLVSCLAVNSY